jgi:hypothetical protein
VPIQRVVDRNGGEGAPVLRVPINEEAATVDIMDHPAITTSQRGEEGEANVGGRGMRSWAAAVEGSNGLTE